MPSSNIIPENVAILATTFMLLHEEGGAVAMSSTNFHPCGTVACHAGWFAIARNIRDNGTYYGFTHSADDMAEFLGFECRQSLKDFLKTHRTLWGNDRPAAMFSKPDAFGKSYYEKLTLLDIGEHWAKVYDRLIEAGY